MSDWHILTVSYGGTVSLINGLTEDAARQVMQRLSDPISRPDFKHPGGTLVVTGCSLSSADLIRKECWGPEGRALDIWKGWEPALQAAG